jgi:Tfp pilus assembly protein PilF
MQAGRKTHLVGWAASQPAEKLNGCCVTPGFVQPLARWTEPWPVLPGSLYPSRLTPELEALRIHAGELSAQDLRHFVPSLGEINQEKDRRVVEFADTLAQIISTHAIATWLLEHEPWDLIMIGWSGLERACHAFMRYAAPQLNGVAAEDCALYGRIVTELYCYYDALLGRIVQLAGPGTTVALVSAAGFRSGSERPVSEALQTKPAAWYRPYGIFCMAGPNIMADELVHNVTMLDVVPTVLSVLGVPAAQDMPGRVIAEAFTSAPLSQRIASWEQIDDDCGMHVRETPAEVARVAETLDELAKLGYSNGSPEQAAPQTGAPDPKQKLQEAYDHFRSGNYAACDAALQDAPKEGFEAAHSKMLESHLETARGDSSKAMAAVNAAERLGFDRPLVCWAAGWMYLCHGDLSRSEAALRQAVKLDASFEQAYSLLARVLALRGNGEEAVQQALSGLSVDYASASLHAALGLALIQSGEEDKALEAFETSLGFDPQGKEATAWAGRLSCRRATSA